MNTKAHSWIPKSQWDLQVAWDKHQEDMWYKYHWVMNNGTAEQRKKAEKSREEDTAKWKKENKELFNNLGQEFK